MKQQLKGPLIITGVGAILLLTTLNPWAHPAFVLLGIGMLATGYKKSKKLIEMLRA